MNKLYSTIKDELTPSDKAMRELIKVDSTKQVQSLYGLLDRIGKTYPELDRLIRVVSVRSEFGEIYNKLV